MAFLKRTGNKKKNRIDFARMFTERTIFRVTDDVILEIVIIVRDLDFSDFCIVDSSISAYVGIIGDRDYIICRDDVVNDSIGTGCTMMISFQAR